jgi:WD40 repeat protein
LPLYNLSAVKHPLPSFKTAGFRVFCFLRGHDNPVFSAAFSPDGTRVVTASADHTARLWDVWNHPEGQYFSDRLRMAAGS